MRRRAALLLGIAASAVYLLTADRSVSWWDCGEFLATGWLLQVGHPSGASVYQLLSHLFMLLSFGNPMLVAPLGNAFSAICGGITVGLLYATIRLLPCGGPPLSRWAAATGALCYLFCDTAWFSAVESEVYAPAMLCCSFEVWLALRWRQSRNRRLLLLLALVSGLGVGIHLMTLLVLPAVAVAVLTHLRRGSLRHGLRWLPLAAFFFFLGLTPYAIIPIRAAANTPINEGNPSSAEAFLGYMRRDQYAKAPLYPRMWREKDLPNYADWTFDTKGVAANVVYGCTYQLGYMYGRYLMNNFVGRENLKHNRVVLFLLPALLGLWGAVRHRRRSRTGFWIVMLLFLFGGPLLNVYLNHPCYEPRERDYAYVLSFYAFAVWIAVGAAELLQYVAQRKPLVRRGALLLLLLAPASMALGNWSDHDRHRCHSVHDIATAHLQCCDHDAVLITLGDNDTFPLWYLQYVEGVRTDVEVLNVGLAGWQQALARFNDAVDGRPVYVTQYFYDRYGRFFEGRLRCEGFCYRYLPDGVGLDDTEPLRRHIEAVEWHITKGEYVDAVSRSFLGIWNKNTSKIER